MKNISNYLFPEALDTPCGTWKVKEGLLSLWRLQGSPNLGIIPLRRDFITSVFFSVLVGYASIHPVKVSISIGKYLNPLYLGM